VRDRVALRSLDEHIGVWPDRSARSDAAEAGTGESQCLSQPESRPRVKPLSVVACSSSVRKKAAAWFGSRGS
jgi:hypothetical protein